MAFGTVQRIWFALFLSKFQSLFFWNGLWDRERPHPAHLHPQCFNPCFSGMAFGTRKEEAGMPKKKGFNPCFSGMAFGTIRRRVPQILPCRVSILVFLEWPLGRCTKKSEGTFLTSFNPCFSGMAFGTRPEPGRLQPVCVVSILVFLEWPLGPSSRFATIASQMFQSLFFWNGLWDKTVWCPMTVLSPSFNPCFSGMAFGTGVRTPETCRPRCFNPCFSGMAFGTKKTYRR